MYLRKMVMQNWLKNRLIPQIEYLKENKPSLINLAMSEKTLTKTEMELLLNQYVNSINSFVTDIPKESQFPDLPFVMIESRVQVYNAITNMNEYLVICYPEQANEEYGLTSFISPLGQKLLLKKVGQKVFFNNQNEQVDMIVNNVEFSNLQ